MKRLPWAIWVGIVAVGVATSPSALGDGVGPYLAYTVFVLAFSTVGALVAARRPRNPIGWLLLGAGLSYVVGGVTVSYAEGDNLGGWATVAAWVGTWVWIAGIGPIGTFGLLLFPDGRLPSRRWRPVAWLAGAGLASLILGLALAPGRFEDLPIENPVGLESLAWLPGVLSGAGGITLIAGLAGAIASLAARFRVARAEQRQQLKWLVYAAGLVGLSVLVTLPMETFLGADVVNLTNAISTVAASTVPIAMGIAILRHRLYDIDVVINRTLVYGALTATLAATYLALVLLLGLAVGDSGLATAASTLAVAALFRPARTRIQAVVDRRFYRRRYDAARTLEAFSARLRDELDLDALREEIRGVVGETVQPAHVSVWLREGGR
ncbi:MAG: hypothetical protein QOC68_2455 [Solirubrobacteraceae bacterium]|nr:hypothetical protein [Solirubrobacteraceae bacterium]